MVSPGVVVVVGDDPWSISTSTPADSRYLYKHLHIPFLEPSNPQELKDWIGKALYISRRTSVYQGILLTTYMAEGGGRVEVGKEAALIEKAHELDPAKFDLSKNVMVPPNSLQADVSMIKHTLLNLCEDLAAEARRKNFLGHTIQLKFRYSDFSTFTRQIPYTYSLIHYEEMYRLVAFLFDENYKRSEKIRLIGVGLSNPTILTEQTNLFEHESEKKKQLNKAQDAVNKKFGKRTLRSAEGLK